MLSPPAMASAVEAARALPQNVEAEAALLGAMMIDGGLADEIVEMLAPDHFYEPVHGRLFERIVDLRQKDMTASPVTLRPHFEHDEGLRQLGGPAYLAQLTGSSASLIGARDFARQIRDLAMLRTLASVGRELVDRALDTSETIDPRAQIEVAEEALFKVAGDGGATKTVKDFKAAATVALDMVQRARNAGGGLSGITTGLEAINTRTSGLHRSDLVILAGRPGMGKSSLAVNIAVNAAQRFMRDMDDQIDARSSIGTRVAIFSLEMSADQLATRILAEKAEVSSEKLRDGNLSQPEFNKLVQASIELERLPVYIDDSAGLSIAGLHTRLRRMQRKFNGEIGLVVVDYLQLLSGSTRAGDNRVQEISEISRGLKTMAKDLNVAVLALSQLSRAVESREDKRPQLSDLRESGSIEQDADMVWFIYRDDYYLAAREPTDKNSDEHSAWFKEMREREGVSELLIAKHRHGSTGKATLKFLSQFTSFRDLQPGEAPEYAPR